MIYNKNFENIKIKNFAFSVKVIQNTFSKFIYQSHFFYHVCQMYTYCYNTNDSPEIYHIIQQFMNTSASVYQVEYQVTELTNNA